MLYWKPYQYKVYYYDKDIVCTIYQSFYTKGQLISNEILVSSILPKNELENVNFCPSLLEQNFFHWFFGRIETQNRHYKVNWPLFWVILYKEPFSQKYLLWITLETIFILPKGRWSRKWQFSLTLCNENVLMLGVGGSKKPQITLLVIYIFGTDSVGRQQKWKWCPRTKQKF